MYYGEVKVPAQDISRFLAVAEQFQVRGLVKDVPKVTIKPRLIQEQEKETYLGDDEDSNENYQPFGAHMDTWEENQYESVQGVRRDHVQSRPMQHVAPKSSKTIGAMPMPKPKPVDNFSFLGTVRDEQGKFFTTDTPESYILEKTKLQNMSKFTFKKSKGQT